MGFYSSIVNFIRDGHWVTVVYKKRTLDEKLMHATVFTFDENKTYQFQTTTTAY